MNYISAAEAAEKWGVSERRVHQYCEKKRIPGLLRFGWVWMSPKTAEKPTDPRCSKKEGANHGDR
ncbi:MAG: DNA-binding protein [Ruthenibacterium sp.]